MSNATVTAPRGKSEHASLVDSFRRLTAWLKANDGAVLVENLGPASKTLPLQRLEQKLGFPVPAGLRALWMMHDGQRRAGHGFVGPLQLLPVSWVLNERVTVERLLARLEASPTAWDASGANAAERAQARWLVVAKRGPEAVLVHAQTGRVFAAGPGEPPLRLLAGSVAQWLAAFADEVEADAYEVVHGEEGSLLIRR